jgi:hypothetical protein
MRCARLATRPPARSPSEWFRNDFDQLPSKQQNGLRRCNGRALGADADLSVQRLAVRHNVIREELAGV